MLFWLCYIFDKDIALRTGQLPIISNEYCDLTLPDNYMDCYDYLPKLDKDMNAFSFGADSLVPHMPGDPRLSILKDKTSRLLYSNQAAQTSDAEMLRIIRELDEELEAWRLSIPSAFRPALSILNRPQISLLGMGHLHSMRHITLQLEYHYLMTYIHGATARCHGPKREEDSQVRDWTIGIRSSMALSLEASRSTLVYLRTAVHSLAGEAFCYRYMHL
ncbi:hypothetical protein NW762_009026 [Fusarium torreyae]|uniref:Transcription factor domain-containing protein n=1 Tax=Fusarium torreyae TaxID=1237075 RepID=A0A9W8RV01_9HYPO|nr:hypothetical protein NW762_009026 [Fusarium torreyae]